MAGKKGAGSGRFTTVRLNERYGLLVTEEWCARPDGQQGRAVVVLCDCGNRKVIYPCVLKSGNTKSCGCWRSSEAARIARAAKRQLPDGKAAFNHLFAIYQQSAKRNHRVWELSKGWFKYLTQCDCYYCGNPPSNPYRSLNGCKGAYTYTGVDRVDNTIGYTVFNCLPCCAVCNRMKGVLGMAVFLAHARKIAGNPLIAT